MVLNTLFSASHGYRIAIKICKDCVLENNEAVEKFDKYSKTIRKVVKFWNRAFGWTCLSIYIVKKLNVQNVSWVGTGIYTRKVIFSPKQNEFVCIVRAWEWVICRVLKWSDFTKNNEALITAAVTTAQITRLRNFYLNLKALSWCVLMTAAVINAALFFLQYHSI